MFLSLATIGTNGDKGNWKRMNCYAPGIDGGNAGRCQRRCSWCFYVAGHEEMWFCRYRLFLSENRAGCFIDQFKCKCTGALSAKDIRQYKSNLSGYHVIGGGRSSGRDQTDRIPRAESHSHHPHPPSHNLPCAPTRLSYNNTAGFLMPIWSPTSTFH